MECSVSVPASDPSQSLPDQPRLWNCCSRTITLADPPLLMGILNVTPDSFSDGGEVTDVDAAVKKGLRLIEQGADILDIGGESTRPGADPVSLDEELRRVVPVVQQLAQQTDIPISIDTTKAEVARQTINAGAVIINDISGLTFDPDMIPLAARTGAGVICMHIQGTPQTMQENPEYENVVTDLKHWFQQRLQELLQAGIQPQSIVLDPGIGFGKTAEHNLQILSHIRDFQALGYPVLIGHSRKRFLSKLLGRTVEERLAGTVGVSIALASQAVEILRLHDVEANRDAISAWKAVTARVT
ncbi:Dihydropteroate synthase [Gimesia panareensis]|uniref:Dihydropteroate synthase n=1 Tax=Gimesia panareensis TaxID=2527978 RepID=A0A517QD76_9PLAN|nr:Dihydropteroate synthase [Gimesia panareensis]QDU52603.1 Dihydropteroate synthase [Gimesia panareensis]